jgi:hypothetical protein
MRSGDTTRACSELCSRAKPPSAQYQCHLLSLTKYFIGRIAVASAGRRVCAAHECPFALNCILAGTSYARASRAASRSSYCFLSLFLFLRSYFDGAESEPDVDGVSIGRPHESTGVRGEVRFGGGGGGIGGNFDGGSGTPSDDDVDGGVAARLGGFSLAASSSEVSDGRLCSSRFSQVAGNCRAGGGVASRAANCASRRMAILIALSRFSMNSRSAAVWAAGPG